MSYPRMDVRPDGRTGRFSMRCARCEKTAHAGRLALLFRRQSPDSDGKAYAGAYMRSYQRLLKEFNYCPACGQWVCNDCYDTDDEHGACRGCSAKKKQM